MTNSTHNDTYQDNYRKHYLKITENVYPSVFALKFFLGNNPNFNFKKNINHDLSEKKLLDIGFGDGRDLSFFCDLGLSVFGIEVDDDVIKHSKAKFKAINVKISKGFNDNTGFNNDTFDFIYSVAALMYLRNESLTIKNILAHSYEILKPGGYFMGTFTKYNSHVMKEAKKIDSNRFILKDPFYKFREGQIYHAHKTKDEVISDLENNGFRNVIVSENDIDWFGTRERSFMFIAKKI